VTELDPVACALLGCAALAATAGAVLVDGPMVAVGAVYALALYLLKWRRS